MWKRRQTWSKRFKKKEITGTYYIIRFKAALLNMMTTKTHGYLNLKKKKKQKTDVIPPSH